MHADVRKEIKLNCDKIIITITPGYCCDTVSITKGYVNKDGLKTFSMSIWDDMSFSAWSENMGETDKIEFEFDMNDPLFFCLNRLLGSDKSFIIDDDDTREIMKKYMVIKKDNNIIKVFIINTKIVGYDIGKFNVFIKNIGPDARSKIENYDTKIRLIKFFRDCENTLLEEYHQITMDEYIETMNQKRYVKKI